MKNHTLGYLIFLKKTYFLLFLILLSCFTVNTFASNSFDGKTINEIERQIESEIGLPFKLVDTNKSTLIVSSITDYFKPSTSVDYLIQTTEVVYNELLKYDTDVLKKMNVNIYIVEPNNNMAAGLANITPGSPCKVYVADNLLWTRETLKSTIHHELFHCFDASSKELNDWRTNFKLSDYVMNAWNAFQESNIISVVHAGEERAEYFSAMMTNNYSNFDGTNYLYKADIQLEQKKKAMQKHVDYFSKKNQTKINDTNSIAIERKWQEGKITSIKVYQSNNVIEQYQFDYINNTIKILKNGQVEILSF